MGGDRHIGGRPIQQDHVVCLSTPDLKRQLIVVADGVGGHWGGEMAAQAVIDTAERLFPSALATTASPAEFLKHFCQVANQEIQWRANREGEQAYSTVVALLTDTARAYWAHVGDSRLYCFRQTMLVHQTEDHSLVQSLYEQGKITAEERATHPDRNQVFNALGMADTVQPTFGEMTLSPDLSFLLCTDGFWSHIASTEMPPLLAATDLEFVASLWVRQAARRGGAQGDNIALALWRPPTREQRSWSLFL